MSNNQPFQMPVDDRGVDELLSRPTPGALETLRRLDGDIMILGVGGKMGPTLAQMIRRGYDELGLKHKVYGVARFSSPAAAEKLKESGIETVRCDLMDRNAIAALPDVKNIIFMAGQKFGTSEGPELTWAMNTLVPANVAERFPQSRIVAFSTGCVYTFVPVLSGGAREGDPTEPPGDYANSCVGRERIFTYYSKKNGTPVCIYRLNYAIDFRYGVLLDVAQKVNNGEPLDVSMGHANMIWQGDANAQAIQCLELAESPAYVINVTGPETVSIRTLAHRFGEILGKKPVIVGEEAQTAWLNNAALAQQKFGYPTVSLEQMIQWVAQWVAAGGFTLGKPTHYEARDAKF